MKRFLKGFVYAASGVAHALRERNFRFHLCAAAFVFFFAAKFYQLSRAEWAVLFLTVGAVLSAELFNTSVERLCDKVSPEKDENIRRSKDCAAGAVLVCAVFSVCVAVPLFWREESFSLILEYFSSPLRLVLLILAITAAAAFVFIPEAIKKKEK